MKKKLLFVLMALVCAFTCAFAMTGCSKGVQYKFELSEGGESYTFTGISYYSNGSSEKIEIEIPAEYKGKPVTKIKEGACDGLHIRKVTIPNTVTFIDKEAFRSSEIETVVFGDYSQAELATHDDTLQPYSLYIGERAFAGNEIKNVTIPENAHLGARAFQSSEVESVTFKGGVSVKKDGSTNFDAFSSCKLKSIDLPDNDAGYSIALSYFIETQPRIDHIKDYVMTLEYVVVPKHVKVSEQYWANKQIANEDIYPPIIYFKGDILEFKGPSGTLKCKEYNKSEKTFSQFVFYYSEDSKSGNYWHYLNDKPTKW